MLYLGILLGFVLFILIGARVFGLTFYGVNGQVWLEELLLGLPGGQFGFLLVVTVVIFILGCFLDFFEIAFILVPLLAPVAETLGIDLIWFGVILSMNLQTSFLTPPFGFALFYLRSVAPTEDWTDEQTGKRIYRVRTNQIYKGVLPFIAINFALILLVISVPSLVTHYKADRGAQQQSAPSGDATGGLNFGGGGGGGGGGGSKGDTESGGNGGFNFGGSSSQSAPEEDASNGSGGFNFGGGNSGSGSGDGTSEQPAESETTQDTSNEGGFNVGDSSGDSSNDGASDTDDTQEDSGSGGFNFN